jgi:nucleotide-binding universal stress UspA family protein
MAASAETGQRPVLIAIGSRGRTGLSKVLLGSVASAVAQHSGRSVLIVHPETAAG